MADNDSYVYQNLANIAQGIFLNIDNNLLASCQKAVQSKVLEICGSLSDCDAFEDDDVFGTDSLVSYKTKDTIAIDGLMNFGLLKGLTKSNSSKTKYTIDDSEFAFNDNSKWAFDGGDATKKRIKAAIQTVENRVQQKIDSLSTDLTINRCVNGRDNRWRYTQDKPTQGTGKDSTPRFPSLLDSYAKMIFNAGLKKAYLNYRTKYDELVGNAMEDQSDDIKAALCSAMASDTKEPVCTKYKEVGDDGTAVCGEWKSNTELMSIFDDNIGTTGLTNNGTRYVLQIADLNKKMTAMSTGKGEFIQTDGNDNMIGSISMISTYSPSTNTCKIVTTSMLCKNMQEVYDTETESCDAGGGVVNISAKCNGFAISILSDSGSKTIKREFFKGAFCSEYGNPVIDENSIKM